MPFRDGRRGLVQQVYRWDELRRRPQTLVNSTRIGTCLLPAGLALVFSACSMTTTAPTDAVRARNVTCEQTLSHHDGDTFTCAPPSGERSPFVVRFASIDAPETGQAYWRVSRNRLRELAAPGSTVSCYKQDRYGRQVCRLKTRVGEDAADLMLSEGLAWYAEDFANEDPPADRERYRRQQAGAQAARRGLWAEPDPMPPKACRQRRQDGLNCR